MFKKILVANRGEIAVRIMRTLREMGIASVALYSDDDKEAAHTLAADEAIALGDPTPSASYLNIEKILAAAQATGAEAIHPGYGFLSENPRFAQSVVDAHMIFIGPSAKVLASLGNKIEARQMAQKAGVAVVEGMDSAGSDFVKLAGGAQRIGYPVLIKAAAGGGGKGMRVVSAPDKLKEAVQQASSEAQTAFSDGSIFIEKYIERPRHVEFQIMADSHGNVVHLFERECSIQRRHQKIVEEAPAPALRGNQELREKMGQAAVAIARAAGYVNAGTIEFLVDNSGHFYFMEVNGRLQVEHPITEMLTGIDLVRSQIEIAAGGFLPWSQNEIVCRGHAIECRIYAENPARNFLPSPGRVLFARAPEGPGIRFDHAVHTGTLVSLHYDPILGKLIAHGENRAAALDRMIRALKECVVLGVHTPNEFLIELISSEPFQKGETHTHFLQDHFAQWSPGAGGDNAALLGALFNKMVGSSNRPDDNGQVMGHEHPSPWSRLSNWNLER